MGLTRRNPARIRLLSPAPVNDPKPAAVTKPRVEVVSAPPPPPSPRRIGSEERHALIAKIAYGLAERAGFRSDPLTNWLAAEREVDASFSHPAS